VKQRRPAVLALTLIAALGLGTAWTIRAQGGAGGTNAVPASAAPPVAMARWRYPPMPDTEMAVTQRSYALLNDRYHSYQKRWQAYQAQLRHCQDLTPPACGHNARQAHCDDRRLMPCLEPVMAPLATARNAVHDQAIALEEAAQQLAGKTE